MEKARAERLRKAAMLERGGGAATARTKTTNTSERIPYRVAVKDKQPVMRPKSQQKKNISPPRNTKIEEDDDGPLNLNIIQQEE